MFKKILIANRGEIACRIINTARRLGIKTVAVYSDADRKARHVRLADEAYHIGGAASAESYLKGDLVIEVAQKSGAQAIHPGYGFLSENAGFAEACAQAGIVFIGPSADAIRAMGLKDKAKALMDEAGVPVVPGYQGENQEADFLKRQADDIGYPVLIKAVAGGGGKGMRLVESDKDFAEALQSCRREAKASFGNDHVLIEKYITKPRHIEVQVFGDNHGEAVYLFERDCSLQRRHQKVVEEAPAPGMSEEMRAAMGDAAVRAAKAIQYSNAGTIEFIVDTANGLDENSFYFMEMNTRLQVEHPVTEMITGQDLVEWQLRVAAGEKLPRTQDELAINGHAFEVRIYAEDPANNFLPQTGKVRHFAAPEEPYVRLDTSVDAGDMVTIHYDPMIAKLIVWGTNRNEAVQRMSTALGKTVLAGLNTNQEFLSNVFHHPDFIGADLDTGFIPRHEDALIPETYGRAEEIDLALATIFFLRGIAQTAGGNDPWSAHDSWRLNGVLERTLTLTGHGDTFDVKALCKGSEFELSFEDRTLSAKFGSFEAGKLTIRINGVKAAATIIADDRDLTICRDGRVVRLHRYIAGREDEGGAGEGRIITPMPGKIIDVLVKKGDTVEQDQALIVMEAMKMEITIRAGCPGVIEELPVAVNDQVADGALLILIVDQEGAA